MNDFRRRASMLAGGSLAGEHDRGEDRDAAAYLAGSGAGAHCRRERGSLGMVDALLRDLLAERAPISVTSVKPGPINTPFFNNSLNKMDVKPKGPPPIYQPGVVAECALYAAQHPVRDLYAGGAARTMAVSQMLAPGLVDIVMARLGIRAERTTEPAPGIGSGALFEPRVQDNRTEGDFGARARRVSLYARLQTHPRARALAAAGLIATPLLLARRGRR